MSTAAAVLARVPGFRKLRADHYTSHLADFCKAVWPIVNPGRKLVWSPAYDFLCEVLEAIAHGDPRYARVIWNMPPRCAKSFFCSIAWPVWLWLQPSSASAGPQLATVHASYSMDLSVSHSLARRRLIESPWFQRLFADRFQLSSDRNTTSHFVNDHQGAMFSTSTGARLVGFGFDVAVVDDPTSPDMALSDAERNAANAWFDHTLRQRANDPATSSILVISQRTHELDVPGYLLTSEPHVWHHVRIPLVAEESEQHTFPSGKVWSRPARDVLLRERFSSKVVAELQQRRLVYASQYQQSPVPLEGNLIKLSEVKFFGGIDPLTGVRDEPCPESFDLRLVSVDCAFKGESHHDKVGLLAIAVKGRKRYILEVRNRNLGFRETLEEIERLRERYKATAVLIEDKANGSAIVETLRQKIPGVVAVTPQGGKESRLFAAAVEWQAGDWYVPRGGNGVDELVTQITQFPRARWDDLADAMSQAAIWLSQHQHYGEPPPFIMAPHEGPSIWSLRRWLDRASVPDAPDERAAQAQFRTPRPILPQVAPTESSPLTEASYLIAHGRHRDGRVACREDFDRASDLLVWQSLSDVMGPED